jgi:glutamate/tyrosine decarboxylase-like PLP-dependent enzyme
MMKKFPKKSLAADEVFEKLRNYASKDLDPHTGRMWGHYYATGRSDLIDLTRKVLLEFMDKTMLDFTTYPSILKMENDVVAMIADLMNGGDEVAGNFTYGGTESIMLTVKAARDLFRKEKNRTPEIVLPSTAHPAFYKSAEFLGLKVIRVDVDPETFKASVESINEVLSDRIAMIVGSAPNYPFGVMDDIKGLSDLAVDQKLWLHVDACMGFVLPFFRKLGESIPPFDFSVEGVSSISVDLHKYGYTPRGASVILYRSTDLRINHIFVMASWPGYPLVNTAVLSTRSAGTLAASWATLHYLGEEGYLKLSEKILKAKKRLLRGLPGIGFRILGKPESSLLAFTSTELNLFTLAKEMERKGWYIQAQPGSKPLDYPKSIHLSISPYHHEIVDTFLNDLRIAVERVKKMPELDVMDVLRDIDLSKDLIESIGIKNGELPEDMTMINELIHLIPPELVEEIFRKVVNEEIFRVSKG